MNNNFQIELVIFPLPPLEVGDVIEDIDDYIDSIAMNSRIDINSYNIKIQSERFLFTEENIESIKIVLQIIGLFKEPLKELIKKIYSSVSKKYGKTKIVRVTIGNKVIEVPYSNNDEIEVILIQIDE